MRKLELGNFVKDTVTGYEGVVIGITNWLYGCSRIGVRSTELKDGKPIEDVWFDEPQLVFVSVHLAKDVKNYKNQLNKDPGGPHDESKAYPEISKR